jgi:hypothetical protein
MSLFNHYTFQPIPDPIIFKVMVAKYFNVIPYLKILIISWGSGKWNC